MSLRYILKRILAMLPTLLILSLIVFSLLYLAGGSPAAAILGMEAEPEAIAALNLKLGFDRPFWQQYPEWLGRALRGDLGPSLFLNDSVASILKDKFWTSLELALIAQLLALSLALPLALLAASKRGSLIDRLLTTLATALPALPSFVLSLLLILIFAVALKALPAAGYQEISAGFWPHFRYLILPATALALGQAAVLFRLSRQKLEELRARPFVEQLRARGLSEAQIMRRHLLKNAALPILTLSGEYFASILAGAVIVETIFTIPGLGLLVMNAISRRDIFLIQGVVLLTSLIYLGVNLILDILYALIDPRIHLEQEQ